MPRVAPSPQAPQAFASPAAMASPAVTRSSPASNDAARPPDAPTDRGAALVAAARSGSVADVMRSLAGGADIDGCYLHCGTDATADGGALGCCSSHTAGYETNTSKGSCGEPACLRSALGAALEAGQLGNADFLLAKGASATAADPLGRAPLHFAHAAAATGALPCGALPLATQLLRAHGMQPSAGVLAGAAVAGFDSGGLSSWGDILTVRVAGAAGAGTCMAGPGERPAASRVRLVAAAGVRLLDAVPDAATDVVHSAASPAPAVAAAKAPATSHNGTAEASAAVRRGRGATAFEAVAAGQHVGAACHPAMLAVSHAKWARFGGALYAAETALYASLVLLASAAAILLQQSAVGVVSPADYAGGVLGSARAGTELAALVLAVILGVGQATLSARLRLSAQAPWTVPGRRTVKWRAPSPPPSSTSPRRCLRC
jgi:hypothetical protein